MLSRYDATQAARVDCEFVKKHDTAQNAFIDCEFVRAYDATQGAWVDKYTLNKFTLHSHITSDGITPSGVITPTDGGFTFENGNYTYNGATFTFVLDCKVNAGDILTLTYKEAVNPHGFLEIGEFNGSDLTSGTYLMVSKDADYNTNGLTHDVTYTFNANYDKRKVAIKYYYHEFGRQEFELYNVAINGKKCTFKI